MLPFDGAKSCLLSSDHGRYSPASTITARVDAYVLHCVCFPLWTVIRAGNNLTGVAVQFATQDQ